MFGFANVRHFFASAIHDIKVGFQAVEKAEPEITKVEGEVNTATSDLAAVGVPGAATALTIERAGEAALGTILSEVSAAGATAEKDGLSIQLSADEYAQFKAFLSQFSTQLATFGIKV